VIRRAAQVEHIQVTAAEMAEQAAPQVAISMVQGAAVQAAIQAMGDLADPRPLDQMDLEAAPVAAPVQLVPVVVVVVVVLDYLVPDHLAPGDQFPAQLPVAVAPAPRETQVVED
jgi:hypothetical protein